MATLETAARTFVVTCRVPCSHLDDLDVTRHDHTIDVEGPGFRHELALPDEADMEQLEVELHRHFLEVRAPYVATSRREKK